MERRSSDLLNDVWMPPVQNEFVEHKLKRFKLISTINCKLKTQISKQGKVQHRLLKRSQRFLKEDPE